MYIDPVDDQLHRCFSDAAKWNSGGLVSRNWGMSMAISPLYWRVCYWNDHLGDGSISPAWLLGNLHDNSTDHSSESITICECSQPNAVRMLLKGTASVRSSQMFWRRWCLCTGGARATAWGRVECPNGWNDHGRVHPPHPNMDRIVVPHELLRCSPHPVVGDKWHLFMAIVVDPCWLSSYQLEQPHHPSLQAIVNAIVVNHIQPVQRCIKSGIFWLDARGTAPPAMLVSVPSRSKQIW